MTAPAQPITTAVCFDDLVHGSALQLRVVPTGIELVACQTALSDRVDVIISLDTARTVYSRGHELLAAAPPADVLNLAHSGFDQPDAPTTVVHELHGLRGAYELLGGDLACSQLSVLGTVEWLANRGLLISIMCREDTRSAQLTFMPDAFKAFLTVCYKTM